jgi:ABC-type glycerol-3-phosphate transport system substrate-binding protein
MTWPRLTGAPNRRALPIRRAIVVCALAIAAFGSGGAALSAGRQAPTIEVLAPYTESDRATFLRVAAAFTARTGIDVQYTLCCNGSLPQLQTRIAAGDPPDVAVVFRPGDMPTLAHGGDLVPLRALGLTRSHLRENFGAGLLRRAIVGGSLYGVPLKASSKSLIWYKPNSFRRYRLNVPRTWQELLAISRSYKANGLIPWAVGCGPGPADSWTLTDWFENIYLRTAGPKKYERLFTGGIPFTNASVVHALRLMLQIVNNQYVLGGVRGALDTTWTDAIANVFGRETKAQLYMEGGFIGQIVLGQLNTALRPGVTIDSTPGRPWIRDSATKWSAARTSRSHSATRRLYVSFSSTSPPPQPARHGHPPVKSRVAGRSHPTGSSRERATPTRSWATRRIRSRTPTASSSTAPTSSPAAWE